MVQAQSTAAMLTTFNEVDMSRRSTSCAPSYKEQASRSSMASRLGFMSLLRQGVHARRCKKFPMVNASVDGTDIVYHEYYDIGVAVSTDQVA